MTDLQPLLELIQGTRPGNPHAPVDVEAVLGLTGEAAETASQLLEMYQRLHSEYRHYRAKVLEDAESVALSLTQIGLGNLDTPIANVNLASLKIIQLGIEDMTLQLRRTRRELDEAIKNLTQSRDTLKSLSTLDELTGIANRRAFDEHIAKVWRQCRRSKTPLSVVMSDIDFFKQYNDHYGHLEGDRCLKRIAEVIATETKRPFDLAARYGGEEFICVLPGATLDSAEHIANTILSRVQDLAIPHKDSTVAPVVTLSLGVAATIPCEDTTAQQLVGRADKALYSAKQTSRNTVRTG